MNIQFDSEDIDFQLVNSKSIRKWIENTLIQSGVKSANIQYIFSSDSHLLNINKKFLNHDYYTDIITFPYVQSPDIIEADIYISVDRVKENAQNLKIPFEDELLRVIIHGVLHLLGMSDHNESEKSRMRSREDELIKLYKEDFER